MNNSNAKNNVQSSNAKVSSSDSKAVKSSKQTSAVTKAKQVKSAKQKSTNNKKLPNTGANDSINAPILGATLSLLGTLTLVSRRKKQQD